jgi:hypothetical protein
VAITDGTTNVRSSCALDGLDLAGLDAEGPDGFGLAGVVRGDEAAFAAAASLDGVGTLPSLAVAVWPGLDLGAVLLGEAAMLLGVTAFVRWGSGGLDCSVEGWSWPRTEYGPAVAGRAATSGLLLAGRTGAPVIPPARVDSGRVRTVVVVDVATEACDELDAVRVGEKWDIAEPGRTGMFLVAMAAFFWANIVSRRLGLGPMVLLDSPNPGRTVASAFLGELGLFGSF